MFANEKGEERCGQSGRTIRDQRHLRVDAFNTSIHNIKAYYAPMPTGWRSTYLVVTWRKTVSSRAGRGEERAGKLYLEGGTKDAELYEGHVLNVARNCGVEWWM